MTKRMKRNVRFAALVVAVAIIAMLTSSCQKLKYGTITKKWYEPECSYCTIIPVVISTGKTTSTLMIPYFIQDGEDYCIEVTGMGTEGDEITRTFYVSPAEYDTLTVGKFVCVDGSCDEDTNNIKTEQ